MGDAYKDVGGRATQDAKAEGGGGGENESRNFICCIPDFPPPPIPLPPGEGEVDFETGSCTSLTNRE
jgi:hypothetical protein